MSPAIQCRCSIYFPGGGIGIPTQLISLRAPKASGVKSQIPAHPRADEADFLFLLRMQPTSFRVVFEERTGGWSWTRCRLESGRRLRLRRQSGFASYDEARSAFNRLYGSEALCPEPHVIRHGEPGPDWYRARRRIERARRLLRGFGTIQGVSPYLAGSVLALGGAFLAAQVSPAWVQTGAAGFAVNLAVGNAAVCLFRCAWQTAGRGRLKRRYPALGSLSRRLRRA